IFSFGVVLYEMATGMLPFQGDSSAMITDSILHETPVSAALLNPKLPERVEDVINRAIEKDRNLRYQHAADIRAELQRVRRDLGSSGAGSATRDAGDMPTASIGGRLPAGAGGRGATADAGSRGEARGRNAASGGGAATVELEHGGSSVMIEVAKKHK